ncbi:flagellar hook-associated protein FlgK [Persephonella sp.]
MSLFYSLSLAGQSLLTHRNAINTTNTNISNVFTEGYSRKIPHLSNLSTGGVELKRIERAFDQALFNRYVNTNNLKSGYENYNNILRQVESVFNDIQGSGFANELNEFFNSFNDIAINPDDIAARYSALSKAEALVGRIRNSYETLTDIKEKTSLSVRDNLNRLNDITRQLATVNKNIRFYTADPDKRNNYLDERDRLLKELSSIIDIKVTFREDQTVDVSTVKGHSLVIHDKNINLTYETDTNGNPIIKHQGTDISDLFEKGRIGGYMKGIDKINETIGKLNDFTAIFAMIVNKQHRAGFDLNGNTDIDFFGIDPASNKTNIDASNIVLNITDPENIAAASDPTLTNSDNTNIKKIINLKDDINGVLTLAEETTLSTTGSLTIGSITYTINSYNNYTFIKNKSFAEYYSSDIIAPLGFEINRVDNLFQEQNLILETVDAKIKELSSVNLDEELINLTKLQRAYEASAKIINVTDELLQTVLGLVK